MALPSRTIAASRHAAASRPDCPWLSVIIVNFRQWSNTNLLVNQLSKSTAVASGKCEIIIIDNNSPTQRAASRLRRTPGVTLYQLSRNRGFGRGVNEGFRHSRGQWVLLLNPDVTIEAGLLDRVVQLVECTAIDSCTGIVGLQLRDPNGDIQGSAGIEPSLVSTLLGQLRSRPTRRCRPLAGSQSRAVAWVTGCGMLIRRECFKQLGGFDSDYFLYFEDVDLCHRARSAGWTVRYEPQLAVTHLSPLHSRPISPRMRLFTRYAQLTYARKHWDSWSYLALLAIIWLEALGLKLFSDQSRYRIVSRRMKTVVLDLLWGKSERAYRRIWRIAQNRRRDIAKRVRPEHLTPNQNLTHGRRPLAI